MRGRRRKNARIARRRKQRRVARPGSGPFRPRSRLASLRAAEVRRGGLAGVHVDLGRTQDRLRRTPTEDLASIRRGDHDPRPSGARRSASGLPSSRRGRARNGNARPAPGLGWGLAVGPCWTLDLKKPRSSVSTPLPRRASRPVLLCRILSHPHHSEGGPTSHGSARNGRSFCWCYEGFHARPPSTVENANSGF